MTTKSTTTFKSSVLQDEHTSALLIKLSNNRPCTYAMKSDFPYKSAVQIVCCIKSDVDLEKLIRENRETSEDYLAYHTIVSRMKTVGNNDVASSLLIPQCHSTGRRNLKRLRPAYSRA